MRARSLLALSLTLIVTSSIACFDLPARRPPQPPGSIAGTISPNGLSGQSNHKGRRSKTGEPLAWRAGDVLVLFDDGAFDRDSIGPVLVAMAKRAHLDVELDIVRCTAHRYCAIGLSSHGRALDEAATDVAQRALDAQRAPHIKVVAKDLIKRGLAVPNDPDFTYQWNLEAIHMPAAWDISTGSDGVVIAVVDSGIYSAHPDLNHRLARDPHNNTIVGMDFVGADLDEDDFPGRDTDPEDPSPAGSDFHGTHVAGILGAESDNGEGIAGVTWHGQILPVRVLGQQLQGADSDIMDGMYWSVGEHIDGLPDNVKPAKVVNLSFGGPTDDASETFWSDNVDHILDDAKYAHPILVAAAGNGDEDAAGEVPANLARMITVGATTIGGLRANYSNYGDAVSLMAPGGQSGTDLNHDQQDDTILSTVKPDYDWLAGTSMAAPHVAGVAALLVSIDGTLDQAGVKAILEESADHQFACNEGCGAGLLDAASAVLLAGGQLLPAPHLTVDASSLVFPVGFQATSLHVLNVGNAPFTFSTSIDGAESTLFTVSPTSGTVEAGGNAVLTLTLQRGSATAGSATLVVATTDATIAPVQQASVSLRFDDGPAPVRHHLESVQVGAFRKADDGSLTPVAVAEATREGDFGYQIGDLPAGDYVVYAVGDDNDDGIYNSTAESFGGYPSLDALAAVKVGAGADVRRIDFAIGTAFVTAVAGDVGQPCTSDDECTFMTGAICLKNLVGGYCSRQCDDQQCGDTGVCGDLTCTTDNGAPYDCSACLAKCTSDTECRFNDGYHCDGACVPDGF